MAGTYVGPHEPALGAVDPAAVAEAERVHAAAVAAALERRNHYHQQVLGQGSQAGDLQPADSVLSATHPAAPGVPPKATL